MKTTLARLLLLPSALLIAATGIANAQATRTWVSGVGDDVNPCSRTAPCKTFAGAISKTAAGGEITVLDPGGFGAVTITKPITINGFGNRGSALVAGTNCIVINITVAPAAPVQNTVILRNLDLTGAGNPLGLDAIRYLSSITGSLLVENCNIEKFSGKGIDFLPTASAPNSKLIVTNTTITKCNAEGILVKPTGVVCFAALDRVRLVDNNVGLRAEDGARVMARESLFAENAVDGVIASSNAGANNAVISLESCVSSNNLGNGVQADGAKSIVSISNVTVTANLSAGLRSTNTGQIISSGNNRILLNASDTVPAVGVPTSTVQPK